MIDHTASLRHSIYWLIGSVAVAVMVAKIVGAENVIEPSRYAPPEEKSFGFDREGKPERFWPTKRPEPTPMFSSNDRSRWATIRALVDDGTYVVGQRKNFIATEKPFDDTGIIFDDDYRTLDVVMNPDTGEFYSSKPPLMSTVLAGEYWVLKKCFRWNIVRDRWLVICTILITINVLPFILYLWLIAKLLEQYSTTDFGKLFLFTFAAIGTYLITFSMTLNNHSPGVYCALFASYFLLRRATPIPRSHALRGHDSADAPRPSDVSKDAERPEEHYHAERGNESIQRTHVPRSPGQLLAVGFFAGLLITFELPAAAFSLAIVITLTYLQPKRALIWLIPAFLIAPIALCVCNYVAMHTLEPTYAKFGGPWYEYAGSHWYKLKLVESGQFVKGIDFATDSKAEYLFHITLGHHGWFSLTPAFFVSLAGIVMLMLRSKADVTNILRRRTTTFTLPTYAFMTMLVSLVLFGYYLFKSNNYGGNTSGARWLFWLMGPWILCAIPAADRLANTQRGRILACVLLGASVFSAFYPAWNPWRNPWIMQLCERMEWINYDRPGR